MLDNKGQTRNHNIDILRIIACFLVVMAHMSSNVLVQSVFSLGWTVSHVYNSIGHVGTILFLFISGTLLLSENYHFSVKRFYLQNFLTLFVSYYAWIVLYHVYGLVIRGNLSWPHIKDAIINIIRGEAGYHFWYVPMMLGIYLLLPVLRAICMAGKGIVTYVTVLFLVVQVLFTTIKTFQFPHKHLVVSLMERIPFTLVNHYVGYFIMGYLLSYIIKTWPTIKSMWLGAILFFGGVAGGLLGDMTVIQQSGNNSIAFNDIFSVTMCMSATGIYLFIMAIPFRFSEKQYGVIKNFARLTFGIYMMHPIIIANFLELEWFRNLPCRTILGTILVFGTSAFLSFILASIKGVRKWLMFAGRSKKDATQQLN